jgi:hypothetical protein
MLKPFEITEESAEIIGIHDLNQIRIDFESLFVVWSGDPFSLTICSIMPIAEGKNVYSNKLIFFKVLKHIFLILEYFLFICIENQNISLIN